MFGRSFSTHNLCRRLELFSTTKKFNVFWHKNFQQVSTDRFYSWNSMFTQKRNCNFSNTLLKITESLSTLSTSTSSRTKFNLSRKSHLVTSFRLGMNVGSLSVIQRETPTETMSTSSPPVSVKSMWKLWKHFTTFGLNCSLLKFW